VRLVVMLGLLLVVTMGCRSAPVDPPTPACAEARLARDRAGPVPSDFWALRNATAISETEAAVRERCG